MKRILTIIGVFTVCIAWSCGAYGGNAESWIDSAGVRLSAQLYNFPQEKMHVTTDQGRYVSGDTVWLRMFTVDAATNVPTRLSYYGYVDVTDPLGRQQCRIKIRRDASGVLSGYIPTDVDWPEGVYNLRAYTAFMQNAGEDYFFSKPLSVLSPYRTQATLEVGFEDTANGGTKIKVSLLDNEGRQLECSDIIVSTVKNHYAKQHRCRSAEYKLNADDLSGHTVLVKADNYAKYVALPTDSRRRSVRFYAEGGYLVPDVPCVVGVKVTDGAGRGTEATGVIVDSGDNEIAHFSTIHGGMGSFAFVPKTGESYRAIVGDDSYQLPEVTAAASVIQVKTNQKDYVMATATGNVPEGAVLLVHNRGRGIYIDRIEGGKPLKFQRSELGEGVVSFLMTDGAGRALSERLVFNMPTGERLTNVESSLSADGRELTISLPAGVSKSDVAVAVLDGGLAEADTLTTICSQLLLQSELRGSIDDAGWYFRGTTPVRQAMAGLDALMLTQGWRRYDIPTVLRGQIAEPQIPLEQGPAIIGTVKSRWKGKPVEGADVSVLIPANKEYGVATTGSDGVFSIEGVDWPEDALIIVRAMNENGDFESNVRLDMITLPDFGQAALQPLTISSFAEADKPKVSYDIRIDRADGAMHVRLGEVVIKRVKHHVSDDISEMIAQKSLDVDKLFKEDGVMSYEELLRGIPGLILKNGAMYHRNRMVQFLVNSLIVWTPPRDVYDYVGEFQAAYPLHIVKRVDFIPQNMTYMFHSSGGALVNVALKDPKYMPKDKNWNLNQFQPLGYQPAAEYYTPDYSAADYDTATEAARPLLYWLPAQTVSADAPLRLPLPAGAKPLVVVEGVSENGIIISR